MRRATGRRYAESRPRINGGQRESHGDDAQVRELRMRTAELARRLARVQRELGLAQRRRAERWQRRHTLWWERLLRLFSFLTGLLP